MLDSSPEYNGTFKFLCVIVNWKMRVKITNGDRCSDPHGSNVILQRYDEHGWQCKIPIRKCVEPIYVRLAISI